MEKLSYECSYLDGKTAARKTASVEISAEGLLITTAGGGRAFWPFSEIRQKPGHDDTEPVRLERGGEFPEVLVISNPDFMGALRRFAPRHTARFSRHATRRSRLKMAIYAGICVVLAGILLYLWGLPLLASTVTPFVPVSWERALGDSALNTLAPQENRLRDANTDKALRSMLAKLQEHEPTSPYKFEITVVNSPLVNALALPGGNIIIFRGLIDQAKSPEEIAGVLAHEMQHVLKRHSVRRIIEHSSTSLIIAAVTGDMTGAAAYGIKSAQAIALLNYSRQDEDEADEAGASMMIRAGLNPAGMISFFERMKKDTDQPLLIKYLSSHPDMGDRINRIRVVEAKLHPDGNYPGDLTSEWKLLGK